MVAVGVVPALVPERRETSQQLLAEVASGQEFVDLHLRGLGPQVDEVVELLTAWQGHDQPPVETDRSIGDSYRELAAACSFCTDDADGAVLGIELYRRIGDQLPAYANYSLCGDCQSVFGEFLGNVQS